MTSKVTFSYEWRRRDGELDASWTSVSYDPDLSEIIMQFVSFLKTQGYQSVSIYNAFVELAQEAAEARGRAAIPIEDED